MTFDRGINGTAIANTSVGAIPDTANVAQITDKACKITGIFLSNPTAGAIDVTIRSGGVAGTAVMVITVPAKSAAVYPANAGDAGGLIFPSGVSWSASATGMFGEVIGTRRGT